MRYSFLRPSFWAAVDREICSICARVAARDRVADLDHQVGDLAGLVRGDLVFHLHGLDHADQVALGDFSRTFFDLDLEDRPWSGVSAPGPPPPPPPVFFSRLGRAPRQRPRVPAGDGAGGLADDGDVKSLA